MDSCICEFGAFLNANLASLSGDRPSTDGSSAGSINWDLVRLISELKLDITWKGLVVEEYVSWAGLVVIEGEDVAEQS